MKLADILKLMFADDRFIHYPYLASLKLKDVLVPMKTCLDYALELEKCQWFKLDLAYLTMNDKGELVQGNLSDANLYSVDYSYEKPVCPDYADMNPTDMTYDIINDWVDCINSRIFPIIQNSLPKQRMDIFDSIDNTGAFLHIFSGMLDDFEYDKVADVIAVEYDEYLEQILAYSKYAEQITESEYRNTLAGFIHLTSRREAIMLSYQMNYNDGSTPDYNVFPKGFPGAIADRWAEYILNMIDKKAKLIIVP